MEEEYKLKLFLLGNSSVGKTSFIVKYVKNIFNDELKSTIGIDYFEKDNELPNGKKAKIKFYDTAGQEKFRSIAYNLIKSAEGIILMYDITKNETFESISKWIESIKEFKGSDFSSFPFILVGNKSDLEEERQVGTKEGMKEAEKYGFPFFETSNKNGINVEKAALTIALKVYEKKKEQEKKNKEKNENEKGGNIQLTAEKKPKKRKCC